MRNRSRRRRRASEPPIIASVALNDLTYDDRVTRVAHTLASNGAEVTVLGLTSQEEGWERNTGDVRVRVIGVTDRRSRLATRVTLTVTGPVARLSNLVRRGRPGPVRRRVLGALSVALQALEGRLTRLRERAPQRRAWLARAGLSRELARLRPAAIHANDPDGLGVAVGARRAVKAHDPLIVYDAHEWAAGRDAYRAPPPGLPSELELEQELIGQANAVVTVSGRIAKSLETQYRLSAAPRIVHNTPLETWGEIEAAPLRELAAVPADCPLLVYVGKIAPIRGVLDVIAAMPLLPQVLRFALLGMGSSMHERQVRETAARHRVADRVHLVDPVPPEQIVSTIRDATLGLMPFRWTPNHDRTIPNKLFQYLHAGLPMVVSDCAAIAEFVRLHRVGEVFTPEDPASLADAIRRALGGIDELRARAGDSELRRRFSWETQEGELLSLYRSLGVLGPEE